MASYSRPRFTPASLLYGVAAGAFWGWMSGGGVGAVLGLVACYVEPLLSGMYGPMAIAGIAGGMFWGIISGAASGAVGGATASARIGSLVGVLGGVITGLAIVPSPGTYAIVPFAVLMGVPAAVGGYNGGRVGEQLAAEE